MEAIAQLITCLDVQPMMSNSYVGQKSNHAVPKVGCDCVLAVYQTSILSDSRNVMLCNDDTCVTLTSLLLVIFEKSFFKIVTWVVPPIFDIVDLCCQQFKFLLNFSHKLLIDLDNVYIKKRIMWSNK